MAILRGGKRIDGYDIRIGLPRDRSLDNVEGDKRFKQKAGPNTQTTMGNFISKVNEAEGFARKGRYFVEFQLPNALKVDGSVGVAGLGRDDAVMSTAAGEANMYPSSSERNSMQTQMQRSVGVFCNALTIPDRKIETMPVKVHGPVRNYVFEHSYEPITLTFYADKFLRERMYFELWQKCAISNETHNVNYYDDYVSQINIFGLGSFASRQERDDVTYMVSLIDCYPTSIGAVEMASETNDIVQFTVELSYRYWINGFLDKAGDVEFGKSIQDQPEIKGKYSRFPWLKKLPPELRRAGRDVLGAVKNRIPYGKIFRGVVFPPVFS